MLLVFLLLFAGADACGYSISVQLNTSVFSYPPDGSLISPGAICQWTLDSPVGTKIFIRCPSPKQEEEHPCGTFEIFLGNAKFELYCRNLPFHTSSVYNRMVVKYDGTPSKNPGQPFTCYIYAALVRQGWEELLETPSNDCGPSEIVLQPEEKASMQSPLYPHHHPPQQLCRWNVTYPKGETVFVTCPYPQRPVGDIPPQADPCQGNFIIQEEKNSFHCIDDGFFHRSVDGTGSMIITYFNLPGQRGEPFDCTIDVVRQDHAQKPILQDFERCDYYHKLRTHDRISIQSPNFPYDDDPGASCRWNIEAPENTFTEVACLFEGLEGEHDGIEYLNCTGRFTIEPEGEGRTYHCRERQFRRDSVTRWTTITYKNPTTKFSEEFECSVFVLPDLEIPIPPQQKENWSQNKFVYKNCDHHFKLGYSEVAELSSPDYPNPAPADLHCRWTYYSPLNTRIIFSCPYTEKPIEDPLAPPPLKCASRFVMEMAGGVRPAYCSDEKFSVASTTNWIIITFDNPLKDLTVDPFKCFIYVDPEWPTEASQGYFACSRTYTLTTERRSQILKSPNHPNEDPPHSLCRWSITAPKNNRIYLVCAFDDVPFRESPVTREEIRKCAARFTIYTDKGSTVRCRENGFAVTSNKRWMYVVYEVREEPQKPFSCTMSMFGALDALPDEVEICDHYIKLSEPGESQTLGYGSTDGSPPPKNIPCRWTVKAIGNSRVSLTCPVVNDAKVIPALRGFLAVYASNYLEEVDVYYHDAPFLTRSYNNSLTVTLGNHTELTRGVINCTVVMHQNDCHHKIKIPRLYKREKMRFISPNWPADDPPDWGCSWELRGPPDTRINFTCEATYKSNENETGHEVDPCGASFQISPGADPTFKDEVAHCSDQSFSLFSVSNKMLVWFRTTVDMIPGQHINCTLSLDKTADVEACECGKNVMVRPEGSRIFGGDNVKANDFPMMAGLIYHVTRTAFCGATIISEHYLLTAANCVNRKPMEDIAVVVGYTDMTKVKEAEHLKMYFLERVDWHPRYESNIAVLRLTEPLEFNDSVGPACLPFSHVHRVLYKEQVYQLGWGRVSPDQTGKLFDTYPLNQIQITVEKDSVCRSLLEKTEFDRLREFCFTDPYKHACDGDTGGPILWLDPQTNRWNVVGITTAQNINCTEYVHTKAVKVAAYLDFIEKYTPDAYFCQEKCAYTVSVNRGETVQVLSPSYDELDAHTEPAGVFCRWQFETKPGLRMNFYCPPFPNEGGTCPGTFKAFYGPLNTSVSCIDEELDVTSITSAMIVTYHGNVDTKPFVCNLQAIKPPCTCGHRNTVQGRIAGGTTTEPNEFPSVAAIVDKKEFNMICGGTVISHYHVLTTARCLFGVNKDTISLAIGAHKTDLSDGRGFLLHIEWTFWHESYDLDKLQDIGMVRAASRIYFNKNVSPACLPLGDRNLLYSEGEVYALGWGELSPNDPQRAEHLQVMTVHLINQTVCDFYLSARNYIITEDHICTSGYQRGACDSDEGGPILWEEPRTRQLILIGIMTMTTCSLTPASVATRVTSYLDWIIRNADNEVFCRNDCERKVIVNASETGVFTSPYYPDPDPAGLSCTYTVDSPPGTKMSVYCPRGDEEPGQNCTSFFTSNGIGSNESFCVSGYRQESLGARLIMNFNNIEKTPPFKCEVTVKETSCKCGYRNRKTSRIWGGINAGKNEFPMVAMIVTLNDTELHCGATIISEHYALTSAWCMYEGDPKLFGLLVGDYKRPKAGETDTRIVIPLSKIIIHPSYNEIDPNLFGYNIAIVQVETAIEFSLKIGPACLPFRHEGANYDTKPALVAGWLADHPVIHRPGDNWVRTAPAAVITNTACEVFLSFRLGKDQLCTYRKGAGACKDDIGGPILYEDPETFQLKIIGVISFAKCGLSATGATRVDSFLDWIEENTQEDTYCKEGCDDTARYGLNDLGHFKSANYPDFDPPGTSCRWTVHSPVNTRIAVSCDINPAQTKEEPCAGWFTMHSDGRVAQYCRHESFNYTSAANMLITRYNIEPSGESGHPFLCRVTVVE